MSRAASRLFVVVVICLFSSGIVFGWEFELKGGIYWKYRSLQPLGGEHLFGPHDQDRDNPSANNVNFWGGINDFPNFYSDHAAQQSVYMDLYPRIAINKAVRIQSKMRIGGQRELIHSVRAYSEDIALPVFQPPEPRSEYRPNSARPGTDVAMSSLEITQLWLSARLPWATLFFGKRPLSFGIGSWFNGSDNTTTESLALLAPYGPFSFYSAISAARPAEHAYMDTWVFAFDDYEVLTMNDKREYDGDFLRSPELAGAIRYTNGPLDIGVFFQHTSWQVKQPIFLRGWEYWDYTVPCDFHMDTGVAYLKYFNGRLFFNSELAFLSSIVRHGRSIANRSLLNSNNDVWPSRPQSGSVFQPTYTEMWRAAVEAGALIGPAKWTAVWAWIPGFDRRHGVYIDRQPNGLWLSENAQYAWNLDLELPDNDPHRPIGLMTCHPDYSNAGFFAPYSYLLAGQYGAGVGTGWGYPLTSRNGDGQLVDANVYALRLDYAAAANLNVWGSIIKAERVSHGYGWGHIMPWGPDDVHQPPHWQVHYDNRGTWDNPSPAIPDNDLGYEIGAGFDWQLLEGFLFSTRFAYWQPGNWWKFACVSKRNSDWDEPWNDNDYDLWGTWPDRAIDPIMGFEITLAGEF